MIAGTARKNMQRHEYSAVLSIFPIVRHLRSIKPEFDLILEVRAVFCSLFQLCVVFVFSDQNYRKNSVLPNFALIKT